MSLSVFGRAVREFLKRTTLHGFKYLTSNYYCDRVFWVLVCCACTCCAGGLCAVLWARFLKQPTVLILKDVQDYQNYGLPLAVCPPPDLFTKLMFQPNESSLSIVFHHVIRNKQLKTNQAKLLDRWLEEHQISLAEVLLQSMPECETLLTFCRWQHKRVPCRQLFYKELTQWGACCVLNQTISHSKSKQSSGATRTKRLDLVLQCSNTSTHYGCELIAAYDGEADSEHLIPQQGQVYRIKQAFTATVHHDAGETDQDSACVPNLGYSMELCMTKCLEALCGCLDPLRQIDTQEDQLVPACNMEQSNCFRRRRQHHLQDNSSCNCPSPCINYETQLTVENSAMNVNEYTHDPIYVGLDKKTSIVVHLRLRLGSSKMFALHSTESWLTLLSSLGGVFNMFLGVGLFSALEFIYLMCVKLPIAI